MKDKLPSLRTAVFFPTSQMRSLRVHKSRGDELLRTFKWVFPFQLIIYLPLNILIKSCRISSESQLELSTSMTLLPISNNHSMLHRRQRAALMETRKTQPKLAQWMAMRNWWSKRISPLQQVQYIEDFRKLVLLLLVVGVCDSQSCWELQS